MTIGQVTICSTFFLALHTVVAVDKIIEMVAIMERLMDSCLNVEELDANRIFMTVPYKISSGLCT